MAFDIYRYAKRGWKIFPVDRKGKKPLIKGGKAFCNASSDPEQIRRWSQQFARCNWGLALSASGLVAVDVDTAGMEEWRGLIEKYGEPVTYHQQSGSKIGQHYVFKATPNERYRRNLVDENGVYIHGIDIKWNGYIVVEPSIHSSGEPYVWLNNTRPAPVPEWLEDRMKIKEEKIDDWEIEENEIVVADWEVPQDILDAVETLQQSALTYDEWVSAGQALHAEFKGRDLGLDLWKRVTENLSYKAGDELECAKKWKSFREGGGTGIGTLFHITNQKAAKMEFEKDREAFRETGSNEIIDGRGRRVLADIDSAVEWMNKKGFALVGGKVIQAKDANLGVRTYKWYDNHTFSNELADTCIKVVGQKGKWIDKPITKVWLESARKIAYDDIVFRPPEKTPEGALNLWTGIPCKPADDDIGDILWLIHSVICLEDKPRSEYLLDWFAHIVQKPDQKCTIVPTLVGNEGTGKGLLTDGIMQSILKHTYHRVNSAAALQSRFNVDQSRKFLTVIDEALWRGDHEQANFLKSLIGADTLLVEEKYGACYHIENYSRYLITTNNYEATKIGFQNRRYLVFDLGKQKHIDFYAKLWDRVREGTICGAFYRFLLERDISHFNSTRFPIELDYQGEETKRASMSLCGQFWCEVLLDEPKPIWIEKGLCAKQTQLAFEQFVKSHPQRCWMIPRIFWTETKSLCELPEGSRVNSGARFYKISPEEMRRKLCKNTRIPYPVQPFCDGEYRLDIQMEDF